MDARAAFGQYRELNDCLRGSVTDALKYHGIDGNETDADYMIEMWDDVYPFPETEQALERQQELTDLIIFSNVESRYLEAMAGKMEFEPDLLRTMQDAHAIKPCPRAYQWVLDEMGLTADEVLYAAGPIWDVNGASAFGMQCAWIDREGTEQPENRELQFEPEYIVDDLMELTKLLEAGKITGP